jgi:DUF917 family protein
MVHLDKAKPLDPVNGVLGTGGGGPMKHTQTNAKELKKERRNYFSCCLEKEDKTKEMV